MLAFLAAAALAADQTVEIAPGVQMPVILLGTGYMPPGSGGASGVPLPGGENATQWQNRVGGSMVKAWLQGGARGIDTALMYNTQEGIAAAIKESGVPRGEIFIMTKILGIMSYSDAVNMLQLDTAMLGGDHPLDCVISHGPWCQNSALPCSGRHRTQLIQETWRALEDFYKKGQARCIGISNYCAADIADLLANATVTPHVHQIERNPYYQQKAMTQLCAEKGIKIQAFAPLNDADRQSGKGPAANAMVRDAKLAAIGARRNATAAQVALLWQLKGGHTATPRVGGPFAQTPNAEHMRQNTAVSSGDLAPLTDAEMAEIDAMPDQTPVWGNDAVPAACAA